MRSPTTRRPLGSARDAAEAAFKSATTKPVVEPPAPKAPPVPNAKEQVSLRLDRDVLEHFQEEGPGWQERINAALRKAAGL
ncbi:BrnA antitoxin family protein [Ancylobacter sp. VNQ12]|uniref:BrnA antitoxin family protein n=1 Tax=Ancylobacter sp. VNQ12 TaxID=3400920 RepID=UPI003C031229